MDKLGVKNLFLFLTNHPLKMIFYRKGITEMSMSPPDVTAHANNFPAATNYLNNIAWQKYRTADQSR